MVTYATSTLQRTLSDVPFLNFLVVVVVVVFLQSQR